MLSQVPFAVPAGLMARARVFDPVTCAVVRADHALVMESVRRAVHAKLMRPILIGKAAEIERLANVEGWDLTGIPVIDLDDDGQAAVEAARLARVGEAQAIMKGHIHTDVFLEALVARKAGLLTRRRLTHVFHMTVPESDGYLMITDGAINIRPNLTTKKHILLNAIDLNWALYERPPKVALLSATEEVTPRMISSVEAGQLTRWAADEVGDRAHVYGPLALDNAVSPEAARLKNINHPVAGDADVLLVHDIKSGNALFKMLVYFRSACAAGIVLGAKVPIILTSRADPPEARLASAALAAIVVGMKD